MDVILRIKLDVFTNLLLHKIVIIITVTYRPLMVLQIVSVTTSLITNADPRDEDNGGNRVRTQALNMLCQMNPSQALAVRAKCVSTL
jgi:hypothetical protein